MGECVKAAKKWIPLLAALALSAAPAAASAHAQPLTETVDQVLFAADLVTQTGDDAPIVATGNVRAVADGRILYADQVSYDPETGIVIASGNVTFYDEANQVYFSDQVELTGDFRNGIATNFSSIIAERGRIAGATLVQRDNGINDLNKGAYTSCAICTVTGKPRRPTWQVNAVKVIQNTNSQTVTFRNAVVNVLGVPVMWVPYLQFPDPAVKRKTGFLSPIITTSTRVGLELEWPYYIAFSDYQDATLSPRFYGDLGLLLKGEYRLRRPRGRFDVQAGFIDAEEGRLPRDGDPTGFRWHFFGAATQEFGDHWKAELDLDAVSDKTYLRGYDVQPQGDLREEFDALQPDRLDSSLSLIRSTDRSYTALEGIQFQSLRTADNNDFIGDVLPQLSHVTRLGRPSARGELSIGGDLLSLGRQSGRNTFRAVSFLRYNKQQTTRQGHRFAVFAEARGDYYEYLDATQGDESCENPDGEAMGETAPDCLSDLPRQGQENGYSFQRFLPTAGAEWSFPLIRLTDSASFIIEPRVQAIISPETDFTDDVANEDSRFYQFDTTTLFDWNKSSGFDLWEDGQRVNVGLTASANYDNGISLSTTAGQQFRAAARLNDTPASGVGDTQSDYVVDASVRYRNRFALTNRFRFSGEGRALPEASTNVSANVGRLGASVIYLRAERPEAEETLDENLSASLSMAVTDRWRISGNWQENLGTSQTINQSIRLQYVDDCTIFSVNYRFDNATGNGFDLNRSLTFNIDIIGF